ncbi:MAG TPA: DUF309 domain-containing protein [Candidatus Acidoferrales bacterium]|nr:DUF309 domain-containing protein [Candidatus Acidoferrales bacterium]
MAETGPAAFSRGVDQFNRAQFFHAHETWEMLWMEASGPDKIFLQGIIQIAAAFHHWSRGNVAGARALLDAGLAKLARSPESYRGIRVDRLRQQSRSWREALDGSEPPAWLALPQIERDSRPAGGVGR